MGNLLTFAFVLFAVASCPMLMGWVICRGGTRNRSPEVQRTGWLMYGFGMLGLYVWAPSVLYLCPTSAISLAPAVIVAGLGLGAVTGYALAKLLTISATDDETDGAFDDEAD